MPSSTTATATSTTTAAAAGGGNKQENIPTAYPVQPGATSPTPPARTSSSASSSSSLNGPGKLGSSRQLKGVAVAGGVAGTVLLGPAVGLLAAGGAVLATSGRGEIGRAARFTGDKVADAGRSLKKYDEQHHIQEKTRRGILRGCDWVSKRLGDKK